MARYKKDKLYFLGGASTEDPNKNLIGGFASSGMGVATGNPGQIIAGAGQFATGAISNASDVINSDASTFEKAASVLSPVAGGFLGSKYRNIKEQKEQFNNSISNRNQSVGVGYLANGGKLSSKKSIFFAETPKYIKSKFNIGERLPSNVNPNLLQMQKEYDDIVHKDFEIANEIEKENKYLINFLKGYTGKDIDKVDYNSYKLKDSNWVSDTEINNLPQYKKYKNLIDKRKQNLDKIITISTNFRDSPYNNINGEKLDPTFTIEANKLKNWYLNKGKESDVIPIYGLQDTIKVNEALANKNIESVGILGHSGRNLGGIPLEWWNKKLSNTEYDNCLLGTCYGQRLVEDLPDVKNIYNTAERQQWFGVNEKAPTIEKALFSNRQNTTVDPKLGEDYNISNKFRDGGSISGDSMMDYYDTQAKYTGALAKKYPKIPITDILSNSTNKKFSNLDLDQYTDSLVKKYGDIYLDEKDINTLVKDSGYPDIFNIDKSLKGEDLTRTGKSVSTIGGKEINPNKFGWRMMLQRSYPEGESPYKYLNNTKSNGGMVNINPSEQSLTEFNNGGTHETSPINGVPQGISPDGSINKVEEGETKWNDYIFSNRLMIDDATASKYNLPSSLKNKSFAEASKKINKLYKERPNDPISKNTTDSYMSTLTKANDDIREQKEAEQIDNDMKKYKSGGFIAPMGVSPNMMYEYENGGLIPNEVSPESLQYAYGGIHINPANRGKFNATKTRTGKTTEELTHSKNPLTRKRAIFAQNAAKWNHADGGNLYTDGNFLSYIPSVSPDYIPDTSLDMTGMNSKLTGTGQSYSSPTGFHPNINLDPKSLRYAPIAFNAAMGLIGHKSPEYNPALMEQPGMLKAYQTDVEPMRKGIDEAYQTGINALVNTSGGSPSALRSNLLGLSDNYMKSIGAGYLSSQERNLANKQAVDQTNLQSQQQVGQFNTQLLNQAEQLNQARQMQDYNDRMGYLGATAEDLGQVGKESRFYEIMPTIYGYNQMGKYITPKSAKANGGKLKMCGGKLRK